MSEREDACDLVASFGDEIVGSEAKDIAEYGSPAKTMKERAIGGLEYKCVPGGRILVARRTNAERIAGVRVFPVGKLLRCIKIV